jgi:Tn3 transposase DDE domain
MTASIRAGTVAPSALLRRLAAYPRQNALARALREIGCLERTLFILDWILDPALRRRSNAGLNKGEARNAGPCPVFPSSRRDPGPHLRKSALPGLWSQPHVRRHHPLEHRLSQPSFASKAKSCPTRCWPTSDHSAGNTSVLMATTSGRPNRSRMGFGRCEIPAPRSSMLLSVRFVTNSAMTPVTSGCQRGNGRSSKPQILVDRCS